MKLKTLFENTKLSPEQFVQEILRMTREHAFLGMWYSDNSDLDDYFDFDSEFRHQPIEDDNDIDILEDALADFSRVEFLITLQTVDEARDTTPSMAIGTLAIDDGDISFTDSRFKSRPIETNINNYDALKQMVFSILDFPTHIDIEKIPSPFPEDDDDRDENEKLTEDDDLFISVYVLES